MPQAQSGHTLSTECQEASLAPTHLLACAERGVHTSVTAAHSS